MDIIVAACVKIIAMVVAHCSEMRGLIAVYILFCAGQEKWLCTSGVTERKIAFSPVVSLKAKNVPATVVSME